MKSFLLLSVLTSLLMLASAQGGKDPAPAPNPNPAAGRKCESGQLDSKVGRNDVDVLSNFVHLQFMDSYKYLLLSMNFNTFLKDRPGFKKLFREESDKLFDDSINLVKHINTRGYYYNPKSQVDLHNLRYGHDNSKFVRKAEVSQTELQALKTSSTYHKLLLQEALHICTKVDAEFKHYFQDEILEDYAKTVRKFTGYYNNLNNFGSNDYKLGVYLFDEHLQK